MRKKSNAEQARWRERLKVISVKALGEIMEANKVISRCKSAEEKSERIEEYQKEISEDPILARGPRTFLDS